MSSVSVSPILHISASLDHDTVLRETADSARVLTGARYGMIATIDETGAIEKFIAPGLTDDERRKMAAGLSFFRDHAHSRTHQ